MELSNTRGQATAPSNSLPQLMRRHPLLFYFLMAFGFAWLVEVPIILTHASVTLAAFLGPLLGPALAAFILAAVTDGKAGPLRLLHRYVLWRVGVSWYLFALLGIPLLLVLGALVLPGVLASFHAPASPLTLVSRYVVSALLVGGVRGGPFLEEFGWRGFALPRMQRQFGPLGASLLLGVLWAFWHSPFFLPGGFTPNGASLLSIGLFVLIGIASTTMMTWVFNHTRGSLLMAFLAHDSIDAAADFLLPTLFLAPIVTTVYPLLIGLAGAGLVLVVLTRGRLSY